MTDRTFETIVARVTRFEHGSADFRRAVHVARAAWDEGFTAGLGAGDHLLAAHDPDANPSGPDFLEWIAARMVDVYGEDPNVDFVVALRRKAGVARAAIRKAKGEPPS